MMTARNDRKQTPPLPHPTRRNWVWFHIQLAVWLVFVVWLRYRARGTDKIPRTGGGLFLINHQSFLDPMIVGLPLSRPVSYLARDSLFRVPLIGWILRNTYVIPINRESASSTSIKEAVARMKHGFLVGIFPEGTRSDDGTIGRLKPGFLALVRRSGVPVYPVGIAGTGDAFPRNAWFLRPRRVGVVYGDPFTEEEMSLLTSRGNENAVLQLVRDRIAACQEEAERLRGNSACLETRTATNSPSPIHDGAEKLAVTDRNSSHE